MAIKIALAGNPNCGKTTLFNELTGSNQYVGNWPGVTVEKKDGVLKGSRDVVIQDLPGIYSLSPYTLEEVVARQYLVNEKPDAIINIVDGTNIERNLYLTTQLLELNIPIVIAINMMDVVEKRGDKIDLARLSSALNCPVLPISALNGDGCKESAEAALKAVETHQCVECPHVFSGSVEHALAHIEESIENLVDKHRIRWYAVKVFERDKKVLEELNLPEETLRHMEEHVKDCEKELDDDSESIITNDRYAYIIKVVKQAVRKKAPPGALTLSDKIDLIATHRVLALPVFALIIWFMYWVSVSTIGTWMTDWANDGVFGDGWFVAWTKDSALFTSRKVQERNRIAKEAFEAGAAQKLAERNQAIEDANTEKRAKWQLACARAWADGKTPPGEPEYEPPLKEAVFVPETWGAVSEEFQHHAHGAEKFEEACAKVLEAPAAFLAEAEKAAKEAAALAEKAAALPPSTERQKLYLSLLKNDAGEKTRFLAEATDAVAAIPERTEGIPPALAKLLKVPVYFEDEESGEILAEEIVDYETYLQDKERAARRNAPNPSDYGLWVPGIPGIVEGLLERIGAGDFIKSLILDGIIGGVGTVFGFLPQILVVFLFLAFLEDCGYMARIAFIMDRIFRKFGLSGKSFIPMLVGAGCGVPAVLSTRTIENQNDRRMTIILATFIPCGAKVAVIAMIVAAFFPGSNLVGPSMYFIGIGIVILGGLALKKTRAFTGETSPFVMELPAYHIPSMKGILIHTWERGKGYAVKAGTIIFSACIILWLLMHFDWHFHLLDPKTAEGLKQCMLHDIGQCFAWIFRPLGFGTWQGAVACLSAEIAKEQATATLALVSPSVGGGTLRGIQVLFAQMVPASITDPALQAAYAKLIAFSFMVCNLFFPPCVVAIAATWREMGSAKWGCFAIAFQLLVGYCISLICFRLGLLFRIGVPFGAGQLAAVCVILLILYAVFRPAPRADYQK